MCGIAGLVPGGPRSADRAVLVSMTGTLAHRGPDGEGVHLGQGAGLGHRRLSIIDLAGGAQPMANEDATIWVTYNGELYNELGLRAMLEARGHRYRTTSDTETLVHLYEEQGPRFVESLNGMFALGIWDGPRRRLILARDRMGQKPLYYAALPDGGIAFGSEPKAILANTEVGRRLDRASVCRYLFYEYLPSPYSIWADLKKLPPAHYLIWEDGKARIERYWSPPLATGAPAVDFETAAREFWSTFRSAVDRHRRADVPIGVFLSGGVDSSSVAAALAELGPASGIQTFSVGFEDPSFDESPYSRAVARHLGTNHHERMFSPESLMRLLPEIHAWLDEPFGDASVLPTHMLSRFAREHVKVVLGGDGADELLAGYPTFTAERAARIFRGLPRAARALAGAAVDRLPVDHRNFSIDFKLKQFLRGADAPLELAHQRWLCSFSGEEIAALLVETPPIDVEAEHVARVRALFGSEGPSDSLTRSLLLYQDTYLPEDILYKVDRASMACGLEVRAPMLDAELVDQVSPLPPEFKYGRGETKRILKRSVAGRLPDSILRRPKRGFGIPVARWLRGPLSGLIDQHLDPKRLARQGIFRPEAVAKLVEEHRVGTRDRRKPLWTLLMFQMWHDHWMPS